MLAAALTLGACNQQTTEAAQTERISTVSAQQTRPTREGLALKTRWLNAIRPCFEASLRRQGVPEATIAMNTAILYSGSLKVIERKWKEVRPKLQSAATERQRQELLDAMRNDCS